MKIKYFLLFFIILFMISCSSDSSSDYVTQEDILESYSIEKLKDDTYYFPAKKSSDDVTEYQPLQRFDLIFVGSDMQVDSDANSLDFATTIPGYYTHLLSYIGKDSDGFAYAVEMNLDENASYTFDFNGLKVDGQFYVYCLGNDYGKESCPKDEYIFAIETYDYMWAKRLQPELHTQLFEHETQLMATMKEDLMTRFPFQLPFHFGLETTLSKVISIVDDGRKNGTDCTSYFVSLFEEVAGVCLDEIRIQADELEFYYLYDSIGQQAVIPEKFNVFTQGDVYIKDLFTNEGYSLSNNVGRQSTCSDNRVVMGMPIPDLVFHSPSIVNIESVEQKE